MIDLNFHQVIKNKYYDSDKVIFYMIITAIVQIWKIYCDHGCHRNLIPRKNFFNNKLRPIRHPFN